MNTPQTIQAAQNTFSDGLIMDFNDLVQPASALTNCLNGTTITYNGNEFVLLNDMGNGRVETAKLPSGYVPVGVKEEGGIIYVASVNPEDNSCQIGSFPSPERNFDNYDIKESGSEPKPLITGSNKITYITKAFGDDTIMRSGDKFSLCLSNIDLETAKTIFSSCYNVITESGTKKIASPKKKSFDLTVAVLNNENNFEDITDKLTRFTLDNPGFTKLDKNSTTYSEDGFFLLFGNTLEISFEQIYNNKLFGEIYLILTINTIEELEVSTICLNIAIDETNYNSVALFTLDYQYNCPDGFYETDNSSTYETGAFIKNTNGVLSVDYDNIINYNPYPFNYTSNRYKTIYGIPENFHSQSNLLGTKLKLISNNVEKVVEIPLIDKFSSINIKDSSNNIISILECNDEFWPEYKEEENLYHYQLQIPIDICKIFNISALSKETLPDVNYEITPIINFGVGDLTSKTVKGVIKFSKVNSGDILLTGWKYQYANSKATINWALEAYPKEGTTLSNFKFNFFAIKANATGTTPDYTYTVESKSNYNGSFTDEITDGLVPRKMYVVKISYDVIDSSGTSLTVDLDYRWLLTTELFNEAYEDISVSDFLDIITSGTTAYTKYHSLFTVTPTLNVLYTRSTTTGNILDNKPKTYSEDTAILATREESKTFNYNFTANTSFDSDLYPFDSIDYTYSILQGLGEDPDCISLSNGIFKITNSGSGETNASWVRENTTEDHPETSYTCTKTINDLNVNYSNVFKSYFVGRTNAQATPVTINHCFKSIGSFNENTGIALEFLPVVCIWASGGDHYSKINYKIYNELETELADKDLHVSGRNDNDVWYLANDWNSLINIITTALAPKNVYFFAIYWGENDNDLSNVYDYRALYMYFAFNGEEWVSIYDTPVLKTNNSTYNHIYWIPYTYCDVLQRIKGANQYYLDAGELNTSLIMPNQNIYNYFTSGSIDLTYNITLKATYDSSTEDNLDIVLKTYNKFITDSSGIFDSCGFKNDLKFVPILETTLTLTITETMDISGTGDIKSEYLSDISNVYSAWEKLTHDSLVDERTKELVVMDLLPDLKYKLVNNTLIETNDFPESLMVYTLANGEKLLVGKRKKVIPYITNYSDLDLPNYFNPLYGNGDRSSVYYRIMQNSNSALFCTDLQYDKTTVQNLVNVIQPLTPGL